MSHVRRRQLPMSFVPQCVRCCLPMSSAPSSCIVAMTGGGGSAFHRATFAMFVLHVVTTLSSMSPFPLLIAHCSSPQLTPSFLLMLVAAHLHITTTYNASLLPPTCRLIDSTIFTESKLTIPIFRVSLCCRIPSYVITAAAK